MAKLLPNDLWSFAIPAAVFLLCLAAGFVIRRVLLAALNRWVASSSQRAAEVIREALRGPIVIWTVILGVDLATRSSDLPASQIHRVDVVLLALWIVSLTMIAAKVAGNLVHFYGSRGDHGAGTAAASATLSRNLAQIAVYTLGALILLNHIGLDIRPLLTALGVGGLAVALALQDTMANLFAGFYISVAGQIRLGDYIKLNTNEEGYVVDITWRSTTLRALNNNLIFIPNSKLGQANVTNYNLPEKKMSHSITVRLPYGCDAEQAERVLGEESAQAARQIPDMLEAEPVTVTWVPGFTDAALVLSINYTVADFASQFGVQSELRRRIFNRLKREGLPYSAPTQIVDWQGGPATLPTLPVAGEAPARAPEHPGPASGLLSS